MMILDGATGEQIGELYGVDIVTDDHNLQSIADEIDSAGGIVVPVYVESNDSTIVDGIEFVPIDDPSYVVLLEDYLAKEGFDVVNDNAVARIPVAVVA